MTPMESLDIRRVPWTPGRLALHMAEATGAGQRARPKRKRRWWPWLLLIYGTPIALAASLCAALWVLRHGL